MIKEYKQHHEKESMHAPGVEDGFNGRVSPVVARELEEIEVFIDAEEVLTDFDLEYRNDGMSRTWWHHSIEYDDKYPLAILQACREYKPREEYEDNYGKKAYSANPCITLTSCLRDIGVPSHMWSYWCSLVDKKGNPKYPLVRKASMSLIELQQETLIQNGLLGTYDAGMVKFVMTGIDRRLDRQQKRQELIKNRLSSNDRLVVEYIEAKKDLDETDQGDSGTVTEAEEI